MAKNATREMTSGSPIKLILSFAVPLLLGMLFQQFYSMVDTIIVGKSLGVDQLAGVGSTGAINFMIIGFCNGVCSGFAIPIAQSFGAKDYKRLRKFVANAAWLSIAFAAVMTVVVCVLCRQILSWMDTPENIFDMLIATYLSFSLEYLPHIFITCCQVLYVLSETAAHQLYFWLSQPR